MFTMRCQERKIALMVRHRDLRASVKTKEDFEPKKRKNNTNEQILWFNCVFLFSSHDWIVNVPVEIKNLVTL